MTKYGPFRKYVDENYVARKTKWTEGGELGRQNINRKIVDSLRKR
jgi:hypothetical protein